MTFALAALLWAGVAGQNVGPAIEKMLLTELNMLRAPEINPAIDALIPVGCHQKNKKHHAFPPPLSLLWVFPLSARVTLACSLDLRNPPLTVPALASAVPQNPLSVNAKASGTADAGCIIPGPFHHCICHASASYSATLSTADGVNQTTITNFTAVDAVRDAPDRETGLWGWI